VREGAADDDLRAVYFPALRDSLPRAHAVIGVELQALF
jgi:hypothetical protein